MADVRIIRQERATENVRGLWEMEACIPLGDSVMLEDSRGPAHKIKVIACDEKGCVLNLVLYTTMPPEGHEQT